MNFARAERRRKQRAERKAHKAQLPARIDLIEWVKMRSNLSTGKSVAVILAGSLKADSHTLGVKTLKNLDGTPRKVFERYVPAELRGRIEVHTPKELA